MTIKGGGGVGRLMEKTILNFHFDYLHPSLICSEDKTTHAPSQFFATNSTFHLGGAQRELKIARNRQRTILLEINDIIEKLRIMLIQNSQENINFQTCWEIVAIVDIFKFKKTLAQKQS